MNKEKINKLVKAFHDKLIAKCKNYNPGNIDEQNAEITNKTLNYWWKLYNDLSAIEKDQMTLF